MRVAVAGGGIAGLTSAIALAARGLEVDLYERAPRLEEIGAGIQLSPNAMRILDRLGVVGDLAGRLCEPRSLTVRDAMSGVELLRVPLGASARTRYAAPYCTLLRADLQAGLLANVRRQTAISLHLGAEVHDVRATDAQIAFAADGETHNADVLVAADGIHSTIRTGYFRHAGPTPIGRTAWRATLLDPDIPEFASRDQVVLWCGARSHLVHYPVQSGSEENATNLNLVLIGQDDAGTALGATPPTAAYGDAARRLLDRVRVWTPSPLLETASAPRWANGRVVLIGDAAHAMAPSAAQGGAMAIEDSYALASLLSKAQSAPADALLSFERSRRPRVQRVAQLSSRNLKLYEVEGTLAVLRNTLLRILPATLILPRLDWLFGWRPQ